MEVAALPDQTLLHSLELSLANLRACWPNKWPGLPLVFERCWHRLGHPLRGDHGPRTQALLRLGRSITRAIEEDGLSRDEEGLEPPYHNRRHVADTLVCMTHLLMALREQGLQGAGVAHQELLVLVIMAGHDFKHPGGSNAYPAQLETLSVQALQPLVHEAGLAQSDQDDLAAAILATDPGCVKPLHAAMSGRDFDLGDLNWKCILAQEADIMASSLSHTQQELTQALSVEWAPLLPEESARLLLPSSRLGFLEHAVLFTSPASSYMGLNEVKSREIQALNRQLRV